MKLTYSYKHDDSCTIVFIDGLRLYSEANESKHWRSKMHRTKLQRDTTRHVMELTGIDPAYWFARLPIAITITRIAARDLDTDNLASGIKHCRDSVAEWLGIDDKDRRVTWVNDQRRGKPKQYATEIRIETRLDYAKRMIRELEYECTTGQPICPKGQTLVLGNGTIDAKL